MEVKGLGQGMRARADDMYPSCKVIGRSDKRALIALCVVISMAERHRRQAYLIVQLQLINLDKSRSNLGVYLARIKLPWPEKMAKGLLQYE